MPIRNKEKYNAYMSEYMLRRYHKRRAEAIDYLGGKCVLCGSNESLEFDHIDKSSKEFDLSKGHSFFKYEMVERSR